VPPKVSAKKQAGVPCTHQFLDTLTVQTTKINPATTPPVTSAASTTTDHPVVGIPSDGQQGEGGAVVVGGGVCVLTVVGVGGPGWTLVDGRHSSAPAAPMPSSATAATMTHPVGRRLVIACGATTFAWDLALDPGAWLFVVGSPVASCCSGAESESRCHNDGRFVDA
jgi:hypothetical protein